MPRDLPVGNGNVLINFDEKYRVRDIYYPHVGQENQTVGRVNHFGIWADGQFAWVQDWQIERKYCKEALVTDVTLRHDKLKLEVRVHDMVDYQSDFFVREFHVKDLSGQNRDVRLFFHQDFSIAEHDVGDTAFYDPRTGAVIHYKKNRWFLAGGKGNANDKLGVEQWAIGKKNIDGMEGTFRDAEDGQLGCNAIAQGSVDSTVSIHVNVPPRGESVGHYWMCFGRNYEEVAGLDAVIRGGDVSHIVPRNQNYWRLWVSPEHTDFLGLPAKVVELYKRSLLVIRTQVDNGGAIIAANDHDITQFARDTYSYMWPRDGALVAYALSKAGHRDTTQRFFTFCHDVIKDSGYLLHKYNPDRSLASSWHPWIRDGHLDLPIQEDETALVLWSLWQHFRKFRNIEFVRTVYDKLIINGADFMVKYRDPETKLPRPSHDLWEERYGVHLFTVASVIAGLHAAANFCQALGEVQKSKEYQDAADEVKAGMLKYMWSEEHQRFCRMATRTEDGYTLDMNIDAAMYSVFAFGGLSPHDEKVVLTMKAIKDRLWIKTDVGGLARYENDYYHQISQDVNAVPGNPWFICTMWLAQYQIAAARSQDDLRGAVEILEWVVDHALPSGCLAEQVNPHTNAPLSVSPLTWSHATFVTCVLEYLDRRRQLMTESVFAHTIVPV
jgi:glucoamylase